MIFAQHEHKKKGSWSLHFNFRKSNLCFLLSIIFLCFVLISEAQSPKEENLIQLTPYERNWLSKHPVIRIAPDPYFPPIEWIDDNGNYRGISADFMQLLQKNTGINFKVIICKNWDEVLAKAKSREVDALPAAAQTPERSKYLLYSDPHIVLPGVIITTKKVTGTITLEDLSAMRVSVVKAYVWQEFLETDFPNIKLDLVPDLQTGLKKVALGISDSLVATLPVALYYIEKEGITNLRVAGETGYYTRLSFASRRDWPEFSTIIKKALAQISQSEKEEILRRWIYLEEKSLFKRKEFWITLVVVVGAFGLIIFGIALWNRSLRKKVGQRTEELKKEFIQRKKVDKALLESEKRYRTLIQTLTDVVFIVAPNGRFTYINPEFENLTGYSIHDFIGRSFTDILAPEYIESTVDRFKRGLSGETIPIYEVELKHKDGKTVPIELKVTSLLDDDGKTIGRIGLARDITSRKRTEEALRKSEEKLARSRKMESLGLLAGGVAHDLNNVLSGIVSYPDLLLMDLPEDSKLRKPIETMQESGHRAAAIVQDLLTVARGVATTKEPLNLNDIISDYLNSPEFKKLTQFHPTVTVKANLDTDLFNIDASPVHIRKVVMNLVSNASEAIEGTGNVTISTMNRYIDRPLRGYDEVTIGEYTVLAVSDDGSGIPSDDLERIFEPFYTKKVMGRSGTGLGLAVVWNIVQDHNGYINVTGDENGTTFEVYFPITRDELSEKALSLPMKDYKGNGETILVVDDVESQREISCTMLDALGYKTTAVSSGEEAVEYLKEHTVDLLLLDMIMDPGIDGRETYERIIKIHPHQRAIIVSGFAETDEVKKTQQLGAGNYIKKPITLEKIGMAVKEELDR